MTPAERFFALLVAILTAIGLLGAGLRFLLTISWRMAQLVERFADHVDNSTRMHEDQEERIRTLERERRRSR